MFSEDAAMHETLSAISAAVARVSAALAGATRAGEIVGSQNTFGEEQIAIDVLADGFFFEELKKISTVQCASSEETAEENIVHEEGVHTVVFDPLDGSSLIDANLAVGSILVCFHQAPL